ncbi:MAG: stage II sporulation protein R [Oscillospiraceae bacterium]|nr:stage II sporulation protein R [Oscillospiraceae bacterium]
MKLKLWELSLFVALVITILWGVLLDQRAQVLADNLIRLHVVAHSDTEADQAQKHLIRDRVRAVVEPLLESAASREEAEDLIRTHLPQIIQAAGYPVQANLTVERFPTRAYESFTLPAGLYSALRVEIGAGSGQNWWCVVFPPLCLDAAMGQEAMEAMGLTEGEIALISDESGYTIRFRALEFIDSLRARRGGA